MTRSLLLLSCSLATTLACTVETSRAPTSRALEIQDDHAIARYQIEGDEVEVEIELESTPTPDQHERILDDVQDQLPLAGEGPDDVSELSCFCFWAIDDVVCCCEIDDTWWC